MLQLIAKWDGLRDVWMREPQPKDRRRKKISLLEHWGVFSETWPTSGMMLDGRVYELPMSEHLIREKECSLLPTPAARDWRGTGPSELKRNTPSLAAVTHYFPKPHKPHKTGGGYTPAIERWERVLGRPAPPPEHEGRLSPRFIEWMMGLPQGWVTDTDTTRAQQLRALGNGVVPSQASAAIKEMISWTPHNT